RYDGSGRLIEAWDPRISPALKTTYGYDSGNRLTTITPPGEDAWTLNYRPVTGDADNGRLGSVSRPALSPAHGTATRKIYYGVPATGFGSAWDMSASALDNTGQTDDPFDATAVFRADDVPTTLPPGSYGGATVFYLDGNGRSVNVLRPYGKI